MAFKKTLSFACAQIIAIMKLVQLHHSLNFFDNLKSCRLSSYDNASSIAADISPGMFQDIEVSANRFIIHSIISLNLA